MIVLKGPWCPPQARTSPRWASRWPPWCSRWRPRRVVSLFGLFGCVVFVYYVMSFVIVLVAVIVLRVCMCVQCFICVLSMGTSMSLLERSICFFLSSASSKAFHYIKLLYAIWSYVMLAILWYGLICCHVAWYCMASYKLHRGPSRSTPSCPRRHSAPSWGRRPCRRSSWWPPKSVRVICVLLLVCCQFVFIICSCLLSVCVYVLIACVIVYIV